MKYYKVLLALVSLILVGLPGRLDGFQDPTDIRLMEIPLDLEKVPLTRALSSIAVRANKEFLVFGVEEVVENGQEPLVSAHIDGSSTVREALTQVVASVPGYTFEVVAPHLIDVFPKDARSDPSDLLNVNVSKLELVNVAPSNFLNNPARFIPELKAALTKGVPQGCSIGPGLFDKAPVVTVHVASSTVRQDLNLVSEASIASAQNGGIAYGWIYQREKFPSKTFPAHIWRVHDVWQPDKLDSRRQLP